MNIKNKKIIHVIESSATGTLEVVKLITNSLAKKGFDVSIIYSKRDDTPDDIESLFDNNIKLYYLNMSNIFCVFKLRNLISSLHADIVHLHSSKAGFLGRVSLFLTKKTFKIFYSPHCISFLRKDISSLKRKLFIFLEWLANKKKSTYLACSENEMMAIKRYVTNNVLLLENTFDLPKFDSINSLNGLDKTFGTKIKVISIGGIRIQKDPTFFAQVASFFDKDLFEFIWVGDGDKNLKNHLESSGIRVTGWKTKQEVLNLLNSSDIYLSTSLWEGMPISILEAMASNVPIVARNCLGNIDILKNDETGILFSSVSEAVESINVIVNDKSKKERFIKNAKFEINTRFSKDRFISQLLSIYFRN